MQRTTIMLPPALKMRAERRAREMGISLGELIRTSLASRVQTAARLDGNDPLLADDAVFTGNAPADVAERHDTYLYGNSG
jgi:hypothetical protein